MRAKGNEVPARCWPQGASHATGHHGARVRGLPLTSAWTVCAWHARAARAQSVELDDGTTIAPSQVLSGGSPGELVLIVDCPTPQHVLLLKAAGVVGQSARR